VYAVGVVLFRLLSGRHPFEAGSPRMMMMSRLLEAAPNLRALRPLVPATLAQLVDRCLARTPEQRPSARALADELAAWADAAGAPPLEGSTRVRRERAATQPARWSDDMSTY
jgi:serine/threonine-protein kinase